MSDANLADLETQWSNVFRAQQSHSEGATAARNALLERYHEVVLRYLRGELRDEHAAGEVYSNFTVRVLEVNRFLKGIDPRHGRFRDYLKVVLRHMVADYYRQRQREGKHREELAHGDDERVQREPTKSEADQRFLHCWRQEISDRAWQALEQIERKIGQPYALLLRLQAEQPNLRSAELAEFLGAELQRPFTAAGVRQLTHRGRSMFGDLLVEEVARSLQLDLREPQAASRVEAELIELGLLFSYCKTALARCRSAP